MDEKILVLKEFVKKFTPNEIIDYDNVLVITDGLYLKDINSEISSKIIEGSNYTGTILGRFSKSKFVPSFILLEMLLKLTDKKVLVNDKAEWLFSCGRDVFSKSYLTKAIDFEGEVLVLNGRNELLGLGYLSSKGLNNIIDRGDFLRREIGSKKSKGNQNNKRK